MVSKKQAKSICKKQKKTSKQVKNTKSVAQFGNRIAISQHSNGELLPDGTLVIHMGADLKRVSVIPKLDITQRPAQPFREREPNHFTSCTKCSCNKVHTDYKDRNLLQYQTNDGTRIVTIQPSLQNITKKRTHRPLHKLKDKPNRETKSHEQNETLTGRIFKCANKAFGETIETFKKTERCTDEPSSKPKFQLEQIAPACEVP